MKKENKLLESVTVDNTKTVAKVNLTPKGSELLANKFLDKYKNLFDRLKDA